MENQPSNETEFQTGSAVVYSLHGRCKIVSIDSKTLDGKAMRFYKLQPLKSTLSRSHKMDPAIWVPVSNARALGLRTPMNRVEAEESIRLLSNRDALLELPDSWPSVIHKLESIAKTEGAVGLTRVFSYLYVLKHRYQVSPGDLNRFYETIHKLLFRELSDALEQPASIIEKNISRGLKSKLN